ncbi:hypothetical protein [Clostridium cellulovorans]|uniref:Uncharacterized protein n=1 Tax=Clostridium cellulovorans (strain ATCC 35296 / DSM 3052 / OCM 3 / 743B) TaxID=573061 RepID=D9SV23_CLOC7|nr:hypothetical protein [Clostridium cellulovorans]ADL52998.1 hypothetical protein Clocel_3318 [Clostridium cellulovorans 743B]
MKNCAKKLILICLVFNIFFTTPTFAVTNFKEGVYQLSNFNVSPGNLYTIQNISKENNAYIILFDEDQRTLQSIRLEPNSKSYDLLPLKPEYRIVIIGNGEVIIK